VDSPHNTIYEEQIDGLPAIVHRHNACRIYPAETQAGHPVFGQIGRPLLLPGTSRTASYVCIPGDRPDAALNSASHGAGDSIKRFVDAGISKPDPRGRVTLRFDYAAPQPVEVPHLDNRGVDDVMTTLITNGVLRPVARLRPFAVLN
jgi:tRNA-splicing ligase RtcB